MFVWLTALGPIGRSVGRSGDGFHAVEAEALILIIFVYPSPALIENDAVFRVRTIGISDLACS